MSRTTRKPTLLRGIGLALGLSLGGAALLAALPALVGASAALRIVIAVLGLAYVLYVLADSAERTDKVSSPTRAR